MVRYPVTSRCSFQCSVAASRLVRCIIGRKSLKTTNFSKKFASVSNPSRNSIFKFNFSSIKMLRHSRKGLGTMEDTLTDTMMHFNFDLTRSKPSFRKFSESTLKRVLSPRDPALATNFWGKSKQKGKNIFWFSMQICIIFEKILKLHFKWGSLDRMNIFCCFNWFYSWFTKS